VLLTAACTSAGGDQPASRNPTTAPPRTECRAVADDARALLTEARELATRDATVDDVRTAASELATSFDDARTALGADAQADLDQASQALQRIQDALSTQPVDTAELRRAASDVAAALGDAAAVCSGTSPAESTS
jgi:hypothetical protein